MGQSQRGMAQTPFQEQFPGAQYLKPTWAAGILTNVITLSSKTRDQPPPPQAAGTWPAEHVRAAATGPHHGHTLAPQLGVDTDEHPPQPRHHTRKQSVGCGGAHGAITQ